MIDLTEAQREALVVAADYKDLLESPGWKRLWEVAGQHLEQALGAMKLSQSSDPVVNDRLSIIWRERAKFMDVLNDEIQAGIEGRINVVQEVAITAGLDQQQINELMEKESFYA